MTIPVDRTTREKRDYENRAADLYTAGEELWVAAEAAENARALINRAREGNLAMGAVRCRDHLQNLARHAEAQADFLMEDANAR